MAGEFLVNSSSLLKIVGLLVVSSIIIFISFIAIVFTNLMGLIKFYTPFIIVLTLGILVFVTNGFFTFLKPKQLKVSFLSFLSLCLVAVIVYESIDAYHNSFETLADQEVDLYQYQPFNQLSKVATLEEESTLKLEGDLPVLDGATALYPLYSAFVQATYPKKEYEIYHSEVMSNKTTDAYQNLIKGSVDIIFVAGPSERQLNQAKNRGVELKLTPIGREAFVFFVNAKNPVEGLTIQQIQDIYSGKITNWSEVGGKKEDIRAFQRPADSGSQTALEKLMGDIPIMAAPTEDVVAGMGGIIEQTANYRNYKNAIGYSFRYFSMDMIHNKSIRHLKIDGVFPDKETIRNNQYPISSEFYAVTAGTTNPNVEAFIEWILSKQGQSLVENTGYVPIN
ncbi:substrate-binding domain-containing protein [Bacillus luteolus]|uniref:Substrate-binding domain-containing protein n=1 Tax=Litchfieldia luteola TaxID=682179 RepID=A0ABR9QQ58_9BACI|nr:substrate-binding domain-containing protein [Cytobacillus luteolus]